MVEYKKYGLLLIVPFLLTSCQSAPAVNTGASVQIEKQHNEMDAYFINNLGPHRKGSLQMATIAKDRAGSTEVRALAGQIIKEQTKDVELLDQMRKVWQVPVPGHTHSHAEGHTHSHAEGHTHAEEDAHAEHEHNDDGSSKLDPAQVLMGNKSIELEKLQGAQFDTVFLKAMEKYHQATIELINIELERGQNKEAKELARELLKRQSEEINLMQKMQKRAF